jgi:hypothetical protein
MRGILFNFHGRPIDLRDSPLRQFAPSHRRSGRVSGGDFHCNGPQISRPSPEATDLREGVLKALILYVVFVVIGACVSAGIGLFVERQVSSAASLIVFLALFFSNFAVAWIGVIFVMDGSLKNAQGRQDQLDTERSGRAAMNAPRPAK